MKMKIFFLSIAIWTIYTGLYGQNQPFFLTTMYFEDAVGNIDTIEVGYDTAGGKFNKDWGEVLNNSPFDSIFDVRAVHYNEFFDREPNGPYYLIQKRIVGEAENITNFPCTIGKGILFFIKSKFQPVTIRLKDSLDFLKVSCKNQNWSFFTPDNLYSRLLPAEWLRTHPRYGCINDGPYIFYPNPIVRPEFEDPYFLIHPSEGIPQDSIFGVALGSGFKSYWCDPTFVGVEERLEVDGNLSYFRLYPNPAKNYINIQNILNLSIRTISIYNSNGLLIDRNYTETERQKITLPLDKYVSGVYFVRVNYLNGNQSLEKFIKL